MSPHQRPSLDELRYFAELITPHQSDIGPTSSSINNLSPEEMIAKLDYHGIALLAEQAGKLEVPLSKLLANRKPLMIANETLKQHALIELFDEFSKNGLQCLLFKGTALAWSVYPQPWLRPRTDSDCFIDHADLAKFEKVFEQLGYQKLFALEGEYVSYQCSYGKALAGKASLTIDVHWRINNRQVLAGAFSMQELHERGVVLASLSNSISIPDNIDSLLIAALHRLGHHPNEERLTWIHDIHCLVESLDDSHWSELLERCEHKQLAAIVLDALELSIELFGSNVPNQSLQQLGQLADRDEPSKIYLQRNLAEWQYFLHDLKAMPGWGSRLQLVQEHLFPGADYMRQQMQTNNLLLAHLKRIWRGLKRVFLRQAST
ncbi:MAG: nucleotidyltransferase family protein [Pseudomonadota bacterium]